MEEKSWDEFRKSGLLWLVNTTLHVFGWSIAMSVKKDNNEEVIRVFPVRVTFRGFSDETNAEGYIKISEYMKKNSKQLEKESKE